MTSHDNVTDIVERLGWHHEHPVTGALVLRNHDGPEAADTIATLRKQLENARSEALEEAAKVCDEWGENSPHNSRAKAIRAECDDFKKRVEAFSQKHLGKATDYKIRNDELAAMPLVSIHDLRSLKP